MFSALALLAGIVEQASALPECTSICSFCSRMKRGRIYACARREGYNVLALGQHLDDLAERCSLCHTFPFFLHFLNGFALSLTKGKKIKGMLQGNYMLS